MNVFLNIPSQPFMLSIGFSCSDRNSRDDLALQRKSERGIGATKSHLFAQHYNSIISRKSSFSQDCCPKSHDITSWLPSCNMRCNIKSGLDTRHAEDDESRDLIKSLLNRTLRERVVELSQKISVTSLNTVSLINTTDDELRDSVGPKIGAFQ